MIVDDEESMRTFLGAFFQRRHEVLLFDNGKSALEAMKSQSIDIVISDFQMPVMNGLDLLVEGKKVSPNTAFIMMTAFGSINHAVELIKLGAEDYVAKPFDLAEIEFRVNRIDQAITQRSERILALEHQKSLSTMIGESECVRNAKDFIAKAADADSPVLILGPSGVGKEVLSRSIHLHGPRASNSFVAVNCANLNEDLLESELFGHEEGAFTGAVGAKPGKFELANGGTLFLDEVGDLALHLQAKLLRVLQEKEFTRVGGTKPIKSNVRIIAATNRDLQTMVEKGEFREDLFYRLFVLTFTLTSLANRKEDIPLLINHFWSKLQMDLRKKVTLPSEIKNILCQYTYPGNIRELQNILERLMVLNANGSSVDASILPSEVKSAQGATPAGLRDAVEAVELRMIHDAMNVAKGSPTEAARILQVSRGALINKLKKYGIESGDPSEDVG